MNLAEFVRNNDVDYSFERISENNLFEIEKAIGMSLGSQLKQYILEYGYLGYKHIELFGVNNRQGVNSDMLNKTQRLHKNFEKTMSLTAIEDQSDGDYYLVDSNDMIYRFVAANNELCAQNICLFEYILQRFLSVKESEAYEQVL